MTNPFHIAAVTVLLGWIVAPVTAQDSRATATDGPRWGGPDKVENQLREDAEVDRPTIFDRWFEWKMGLVERHGFSFSVDYSAVWLGADSSPGDDRSAGGMVRFFGAWDLVGRGTKNTGTFVWKAEHRHAYTDVAPSGFSFELGNIGPGLCHRRLEILLVEHDERIALPDARAFAGQDV